MKKQRYIWIAIAIIIFEFFACLNIASAESGNKNIVNDSAFNRSFTTPEGKTYELGISGFRQYLEQDLFYKNDEIYFKLKKDFSSLESRRDLGFIIGAGSVVAGGILMWIAEGVENDPDSTSNERKDAENLGLKGLLVFLGGGVLGFKVISPGKEKAMDEITKLIEKHNMLYKDSPLKYRNIKSISRYGSTKNYQLSVASNLNSHALKFSYRF